MKGNNQQSIYIKLGAINNEAATDWRTNK
jgi:hypothetical protein